MSKLIFLFLAFILCASCDNTCESTKIGDKFLSDETRAYLPYKVGQRLTFESDSGMVKTFVVSEESNNSKLCINVTCQPFDPYKTRGCDYYEGESYYYTIRDEADTIYLHLKAGIEPYEDAKELFYDYVQIGLTGLFDSYFAGDVPKIYFTEPVFDIKQSFIDSILVHEMNYVAGDKSYSNVEVKEFKEAALVFDKSKGFVAFKYKDVWWRLKE